MQLLFVGCVVLLLLAVSCVFVFRFFFAHMRQILPSNKNRLSLRPTPSPSLFFDEFHTGLFFTVKKAEIE